MYTFISRQSQLLSLSNGHHQFYFRFRLILLQLDLHTAKELWSARDLAWLPPHLSKTLIHINADRHASKRQQNVNFEVILRATNMTSQPHK